MIRARRTLTAFAIALAAGALCAADAPAPLAQRPEVAAALEVFDVWADWTAKNREQPAVSIGIVYDQDLIWAKGYGYANLAKKIPATPATAYRIASISKTFTAHALLQLRDAGKLQLDDPITKWIPELKLSKIDPQSPAITIRHILTHTSGIPREVDGTYWNDMNFPSREAMTPVLARMGVVWEPDKEWKYSNVALGLAGYIVEAASGEPYAEYMARHVHLRQRLPPDGRRRGRRDRHVHPRCVGQGNALRSAGVLHVPPAVN
jgi:CubicO group peptidase (beta-lactamase class C family)